VYSDQPLVVELLVLDLLVLGSSTRFLDEEQRYAEVNRVNLMHNNLATNLLFMCLWWKLVKN